MASLAPGEAAVEARGISVRTGDGAIVLTRAVLESSDDDESTTVVDGPSLAELLERQCAE